MCETKKSFSVSVHTLVNPCNINLFIPFFPVQGIRNILLGHRAFQRFVLDASFWIFIIQVFKPYKIAGNTKVITRAILVPLLTSAFFHMVDS